jgi:hypothetical protein
MAPLMAAAGTGGVCPGACLILADPPAQSRYPQIKGSSIQAARWPDRAEPPCPVTDISAR